MTRRRHELGAAEYAILGLLALAPRHGYQLASHFMAAGTLGRVCTLGLSQLYALLHALESLGYVRAERSSASGGPPRKVFSLTATGDDELRRWLDRPVARIREVRLDLLLKLFFSRQLTDHDTDALLRRQIDVCRAWLARLEVGEAATPPDSFAALVLSSRRTIAEATLTWLLERQGGTSSYSGFE